ncbi:MAG: c-type cytochrome [Aeromonas sp.]
MRLSSAHLSHHQNGQGVYTVLIKNRYLLMMIMAAASCSGVVLAADQMSPAAIAERIKPVGQVYSAHDLAGFVGASAAAPVTPTGARDGETVYKAACFACHDTGAAGAPKRGDQTIWQPRIAQGMAVLTKHAIEGFRGQVGIMPPRGTCMSCSDDEIINAVHYLTGQG